MRVDRARLDGWRQAPAAFVREVFGVVPDPWQEEVLEAFPDKPRIAMKACKGPGKTAVQAWLGWNFLATRRDAKIAATSITADNLADNLWSEMAKLAAAGAVPARSLSVDEVAHFRPPASRNLVDERAHLEPHRRPQSPGQHARRPACRQHPVHPG
jgi:hypothetical protein